MTIYSSSPATEPLYNLAEGVIWDDRAQLVRWVDVVKGRVLAGELRGGRIVRVEEFHLGQSASAVALAEDGGLLIAVARGFATISPAGTISLGPDLLGDRKNLRLNDGSVDPSGRFVVGTAAIGELTGDEVLLRVSNDGAVETLRDGISLSNGIAFSPDGATIYHVDTFAGTVSSHSYGTGSFDRNEPWATVLNDFPAYPDGLTVDADGALWVALWNGSSVQRYAASGELIDTVTVDAPQASCPGFVGPTLSTLAITTAQEGLEAWTDHSGALFLADVDATGLPVPRWTESTTTPHWLRPEPEEEVSA